MEQYCYYALGTQKTLVQNHQYVPITELISFFQYVRQTCFCIKSERQHILRQILTIRQNKSSAPFNKYERFPDEYFVNLSVGAVGDAFDRLQDSLDIPEISDSQLSEMNITDLNNWKEVFQDAINELKRLVYITDPQELALNGVYNYCTFERTFKLQWSIERD